MSNGAGVYYGEFWEGLRHGVGTLIEYFSDNDEIDATKDSIDIDDEEHECLQSCSSGEEDDRKIEAQDISLHSINLDECLSHNNSDNGPDFAAGGSSLLSIISDEHTTTNAEDPSPKNNSNTYNSSEQEANPLSKVCSKASSKRNSKTQRKQRFSSGVWVAGQYEIVDSRDLFHGSHKVKETDVNVSNENLDHSSNGKNNVVSSPSLNRTTWDLLDEKWLGLA